MLKQVITYVIQLVGRKRKDQPELRSEIRGDFTWGLIYLLTISVPVSRTGR